MRNMVASVLMVAFLLVGCAKHPPQNHTTPSSAGAQVDAPRSDSTPRPIDPSKVNQVVVEYPSTHTSKTITNADAARLAKALMDSPASSGALSAGCHEELQLKLYVGSTLVISAEAGIGNRPIKIEGENATRQPTADAKQLLQALNDLLADPYMAQFISYCEAWEAARFLKPDAAWRVVFMPEVPFAHDGTLENVPTWLAVTVGPDGSREKVYVDARKDRGSHVYRVLNLEPEKPNLPDRDGKGPLTPVQALALVCNSVACNMFEAVDIEFRAEVPLPMSNSGETFPAWAITLADKSTHLINEIGLFSAYTGGLVTEEMPSKK